jgi:hypothetical protein
MGGLSDVPVLFIWRINCWMRVKSGMQTQRVRRRKDFYCLSIKKKLSLKIFLLRRKIS